MPFQTEIKNCKNCGHFFKKVQPRHVFCSNRCRAHYNWVHKYKEERQQTNFGRKKCEKCNKEFKKHVWNQRYCSVRCRNTHYYDIQFRSKVQPRHCIVCNQEYRPRQYNHLYCTETCRKQHVANRNMAIFRTCENCHSQFQSPQAHARFCCDPCRQDWKKLHYAGHRPTAKDADKSAVAQWQQALNHCAAELGVDNPIGPAYKHQKTTEITGDTDHADAVAAFLNKGGKIDKYTMVDAKPLLNEVGWPGKRAGGLRKE